MVYDICQSQASQFYTWYDYVVSAIIVQLNSQYDYYHPLLPMFYIVPIPVRFNQTTYHVTEGTDSYAVITLEALAIPTRSFSVYVNVRDNRAVGEHHAIRSLWTNLFQYHCT